MVSLKLTNELTAFVGTIKLRLILIIRNNLFKELPSRFTIRSSANLPKTLCVSSAPASTKLLVGFALTVPTWQLNYPLPSGFIRLSNSFALYSSSKAPARCSPCINSSCSPIKILGSNCVPFKCSRLVAIATTALALVSLH